MCNLVTLKASVDEVASAFGARRPRTNAQPGEVYPGGQGFVVRDDAGTRASYIMGSSFSAVGLALVLVSPTPGRSAYRKYSAMPDEREWKRALSRFRA